MKKKIAILLKKTFVDLKVNLKKEEIENLIEVPPSIEMGDYSFPCFLLAKKLKKNPHEIALKIKEKISDKNFEDVKVLGAYVNFFVNKKKFAKNIIKEILKDKENFGKTDVGKKEKTMVEFCHANTHKAFHIGHTRNISIGESISRTMEFLGYDVIRTNYQGDVGMHVAKTIWGMFNLKKLRLKIPVKDKGKWLGIVYAKASQMTKNNKKIAEEVNKINQQLYSKDKELIKIWEKTRQWSIDYFEKNVYPDFGTNFDRFYFESEVEKKGIEIVKSLLKKRIAKKSKGAIIINLEKYGLDIFLILKSDGTPLYSTKDLYLAELQNKEYSPKKILHIVGSEQNFYFKQLIKTLELINPKIAKKEKHISYELVTLSSGKMASREGKVVLYDDTLKKMMVLAKKQMKKRNKLSNEELEKRARIISLGAIKYAMLSQNTNKTIIFDENKTVSFEGDTGPYLLYSYARASSILRKTKKQKKSFKIKNPEKIEIELVKKLSQFPEIVLSSYKNLNPSLIANYSYQLAQIFNGFYHSSKVIGSDEEEFRLALVNSFRIVLKNSLKLLGINVVEKM
jgi:arginyl-tRNA synthetase|tara:strand:- start:484 stop:2184 length:1701 start_codon:yes stop_codon:yes gene_type:complete